MKDILPTTPIDYLALAANSPKVEEADTRQSHIPYGNNFFMLFMGFVEDSGELCRMRFERAQGLGRPWNQFVTSNQELLTEIDRALEGLTTYRTLLRRYTDLLAAKNLSEADELDRAANHPLGIEAVGLYAWDKLNPLLENAAGQMRLSGIKPEQFYG